MSPTIHGRAHGLSPMSYPNPLGYSGPLDRYQDAQDPSALCPEVQLRADPCKDINGNIKRGAVPKSEENGIHQLADGKEQAP